MECRAVAAGEQVFAMQSKQRVFGTVVLVVAVCMACSSAAPQSSPAQASAAGDAYTVRKANSHLLAVTGKTGLFSFAAHDHAVMATQWTAAVNLNLQQLSQSGVTVSIPVSALVIDSDEARKAAGLGSGPGPDDVRKIQQRMLSSEILDAQRYATIEFRSSQVRVISPEKLEVTGDLTLHGRSQTIKVQVDYAPAADGGYLFKADFPISQSDFGLKPESVAGGTVKVKDEVKIKVQLSVGP
jgi:polyisoprenoid-binding protein YceI